MKAVPGIIVAFIVLYGGMGHKFEIDPIPVPADIVINDQHIFTLPAMDAIGGSYFVRGIGLKSIIVNSA